MEVALGRARHAIPALVGDHDQDIARSALGLAAAIRAECLASVLDLVAVAAGGTCVVGAEDGGPARGGEDARADVRRTGDGGDAPGAGCAGALLLKAFVVARA